MPPLQCALSGCLVRPSNPVLTPSLEFTVVPGALELWGGERALRTVWSQKSVRRQEKNLINDACIVGSSSLGYLVSDAGIRSALHIPNSLRWPRVKLATCSSPWVRARRAALYWEPETCRSVIHKSQVPYCKKRPNFDHSTLSRIGGSRSRNGTSLEFLHLRVTRLKSHFKSETVHCSRYEMGIVNKFQISFPLPGTSKCNQNMTLSAA